MTNTSCDYENYCGSNSSREICFQRGLRYLCNCKCSSAEVYLREAASLGNKRTCKYAVLLENKCVSKSKWIDHVFDFEVKYIIWGI